MTISKLLECQRRYRCTKCKEVSVIDASYELGYVFCQPRVCPKDRCYGKNIVQVNDLAVGNCKDYQEIKVQERVLRTSVKSVPNSMWVTLEDDLVDSCKPGDDVTIRYEIKILLKNIKP